MKFAKQNVKGSLHNDSHDPSTIASYNSFSKNTSKDSDLFMGKVRTFNLLSCVQDRLLVLRVPVLANLRKSKQNVQLQLKALDPRSRRARKAVRSNMIVRVATTIGALFPRSYITVKSHQSTSCDRRGRGGCGTRPWPIPIFRT